MNGKTVIGIAGTGLIGGSFAADMQSQGHGVLCHDTDRQACDKALEMGLAHAASTDVDVLADCTALMVAVPVCETRKVLHAIAALDAPNLRAVFDVGSTKSQVIEWAQAELGDKAELFVPCHPIAGREHSGVAASVAGLFKGRQTVVCTPSGGDEALELVTRLWKDCGAGIQTMDAAAHDKAFAAVSHLPHLLAYSLVSELGRRPDRDMLLGHAASGFADFTRIASSDPDMWRDVCLTNKDNILAEISTYLNMLERVHGMVEQGDGPAMREFFRGARDLRDGWLEKKEQG